MRRHLPLLAILVLALTSTLPVLAANCTCYYASDCADGQYCNWQDQCTRHCELQGTWNPNWGAPPQSRPDCDSWSGPCHDDQPVPPNGNDGDGENCEPPSANTPAGGTMNFKMRDGVCATRPVKQVDPKLIKQDAAEVERATQELVGLAQSGGGLVVLNNSPYVTDVMHNLATLALGLYDYASRLDGPPIMGDVRGTCGPVVLATLGEALRAEILSGATIARPFVKRGENHADTLLAPGEGAQAVLSTLSYECAQWVQSRPMNCQYPHPVEHAHVFEYPDGISCIAHQIVSMSQSLYDVSE